MLGVAGVPAVLQGIIMFFLPESPRWLFRQVTTRTSILALQKFLMNGCLFSVLKCLAFVFQNALGVIKSRLCFHHGEEILCLPTLIERG